MKNLFFYPTCSANLYSSMEPLNAEQFSRMTQCESTYSLINAYRQTKKAKDTKQKLPVCCFQAMFDSSTNKDGIEGCWRENQQAHLTGLVMIDIDHVENPQSLIDGWLSRGEDWLREQGILLVYITPSGEGVKVVFIARSEWGNLIDNQYEMAQLLGVAIDAGCRDAARASFVPKSDDVKWMDDRLFNYSDAAYDEQYGPLYRRKPAKTGPTNQKWKDYERQQKAERKNRKSTAKTGQQTPAKTGQQTPAKTATLPVAPQQSAPTYHGVEYSKIAQELLNEIGAPEAGDRHATMMKMGYMLSVICDNNPQLLSTVMQGLPFVGQIIQERGLQEVENGMQYIAEHPTYVYPTKDLKAALRKAGVPGFETQDKSSPDLMPLAEWADEIEALMPYYPCLREICHGVPREVWPAALFVGAAFFGTLMTRCTYHYYWQPYKECRLNYLVYIVGVPGSGKSFAVRLSNLILAPIKREAEVSNAAVNNYKRDAKARGTSTKAQNQEALKKPTAINRYMPARTSNGVFIENMNNAIEINDGQEIHLHMVTFDTEMCNSTKMQKGGQWIDKSTLELKSFHNEEDGQNYANNDSYSGFFNVFWNIVYTGTPDALREKVNKRNFGSGLGTRLAAIPMPTPSFKTMPSETTQFDYTASDATLSLWAERQNTRRGELPLARLVNCCADWTEHRKEIAEFNNEDYADLMLIERVGYYGINVAAPFVDMRHRDEFMEKGTYETDDIDERLCRLAMNIQYSCQHHFFGALANSYFDDLKRDAEVNSSSHNSRYAQCFKLLPEEFTKSEFTQTFGLANNDSATKQLRSLEKEGAVRRQKRGHYVKLVANL